ncbi:MAG: SGNH/GDSL hydrolase family protein [Acutalibacteraceae bacterium]
MKLTSEDIVLFSGDSITDGNRGHKMDLNHIMGHGYQTIVAGQLALQNADSRPRFINKGYSGYTMGQLLKTWQEDVLNNRPTVLSILAGVNDGNAGYYEGLTPEAITVRYRNNLQTAVTKTVEALDKIKIVIVEPFFFPLDRSDLSYRYTPHPACEATFPRPDREETAECTERRLAAMRTTQQAAREVAEQNGCIFVPLQKRFEAAMQNSKREYFIWDGTHPTIAGHALIAEAWLETVK